jgi:beta-lactamase regulating signal transducer with metallopeptidase domain
MWVGLDRFSRVLVDATLAATILLSMVVVVMLVCRQPARRIVLAQAAIVLSVLMIPLVAADFLPKLEVPSWLSLPEPGLESLAMTQDGESSCSPQSRAFSADQGRATSSGFLETGSWWTGPWPLRVLTLVYLGGVIIGLAWFLLGLWGAGRLIRGSVEPVAMGELYRELLRELGGRSSSPRLRVSPRVNRPVLAGLVHPTILIPTKYDRPEFDRELLKIIIIHELAHADQGDSRFSTAASLAQSLWFFLPFPWWLRSQLRMDQEFVADQKTVLMAGSSAGYATRLVGLAAPSQQSPAIQPPSVSGAMLPGGWWDDGFKSPLLQRVAMLLHCPFPIELQPPRWWCLSAQLSILGLALLSASTSRSLFQPVATAAIAPSSTQEPARFQVSHFVATPRVVSRSGRSLPYVFPLLLPLRCDLSVEIQASRSALARTRLVGLPLDSQAAPRQGSQQHHARADGENDWHRVHLARAGDRVRLEVDGQNVSVRPGIDILSEWVMIEPAADETAVLRNLVITW